MEKISIQTKHSAVPAEVDRWNWGAFLLTWIWGICNNTFIALVMFVPGANIIMPFILGAKGSAWAWKNNEWESIEHFKRVQRKWALYGIITLLMVVVLPVLALFAFALTRDPRFLPSPLIEREAPAFSLKLFDGTTFTLAEHRGKVMVMNVWSSWCIPACYNEAPALEAAWQRFRTRDVLFLGVNYQDREAAAREFLARFHHTFPNGPDLGSRVSIAYGVYGVPETFFIDRQGRVAYKHVGEITLEILSGQIERLLNGVGETS